MPISKIQQDMCPSVDLRVGTHEPARKRKSGAPGQDLPGVRQREDESACQAKVSPTRSFRPLPPDAGAWPASTNLHRVASHCWIRYYSEEVISLICRARPSERSFYLPSEAFGQMPPTHRSRTKVGSLKMSNAGRPATFLSPRHVADNAIIRSMETSHA